MAAQPMGVWYAVGTWAAWQSILAHPPVTDTSSGAQHVRASMQRLAHRHPWLRPRCAEWLASMHVHVVGHSHMAPAEADSHACPCAQETAINIAFACSVLRGDMTQYIINVALPEVTALEDAGKVEVSGLCATWQSGRWNSPALSTHFRPDHGSWAPAHGAP